MLAAVHAYFSERLREMALDRLMSKKDASHLADANEAIEKAFSLLKENYEPVKKANITNKAR